MKSSTQEKNRAVSLAVILAIVVVSGVVFLSSTKSEHATEVEKTVAVMHKNERNDVFENVKIVSASDMEKKVMDALSKHELHGAKSEMEAREILMRHVESSGEDESLVDRLVSEWSLTRARVAADSQSKYAYNRPVSPALGGRGGSGFTFEKAGKVITMVCVRSGALLDQIKVMYSDGSWSSPRGGNGGQSHCFRPSGQCIASVFIKTGSLVDGILFVDKDGSISPYYGGYGGSGFAISNDGERCLYKIVGRSGSLIDNLQFFFKKVPSVLPCAGPDVAAQRPTGQSSIGWGGSSARAVDGNPSQNYWQHSCTHTAGEVNPWWYVDIGKQNTVCAVKIFNRQDCCADRLKNFKVFVTNRQPTNGFVVQATEVCAAYGSTMATFSVQTLKCMKPMSGRYVGIQIGGREYLTICEFQVYTNGPALPQPGCTGTTDLARGKPTGQISTGWGGASGRAVDGNPSGNYWHHSCTHTALANNPWWYVEVGAGKRVCKVKIYNRQDCCTERLSNFKIFVTNREPAGNFNVLASELCYFDNSKGPFSVKTIVCNQPLTGKYVGVQIVGRQYLTICQFEVYS